MGMEKKVVSIRLDEDFIEHLKTCAKAENRPLSNFIETVLKEHLSGKESAAPADNPPPVDAVPVVKMPESEGHIAWNKRYSDDSRHPGKDSWLQSQMAYIEEKQGYAVVDLGCGKGQNALQLKEQGYNVIACDFSPVALDYIRNENPFIKTRCFDMIGDFPQDIRNVGVVLASLSTHYFALDDTARLYENIRDMLEPGGYFILRVNSRRELEIADKPNISGIIEQDYYLLNDGTAKRYFDADSLTALLTGFSIIRVNEACSEYYGRSKHFIECVAQKV